MLEFKNRDATNGSFFYFEGQQIDLEVLEKLSDQSKSVKPTLSAILAAVELKDDESTVSTSTIAEKMGITIKALNDRLRQLRKLNFIVELPFVFTGEKTFKRRTMCFAVQFEQESIDNVNSDIEKKKTEIKKLAVKREFMRKAQKEIQLGDRPDVSNKLPCIVRHSNSFPIEQLAINGKDPRTKMAKKFYVTSEDGETKTVLARIQSHSRILDSDDLQVLFATYTLIRLYHEKESETHFLNGTTPNKLTPVYVDDILLVQQRALGGKSRRLVRESFKAIRDTEYDMYGLTNIKTKDGNLSFYGERRFRNFSECIPLSEYAPEISKDYSDVIFGDDSMIYLIELPDHIFESLMYNKTLFAFPTNSLSAPSLIFLLYLRFRSKCNNSDKYDDSLKNLNKVIAPSKRLGDFKRSLITSMKRLSKIDDPYLFSRIDTETNEITFNLWGYHGKISTKENYLTIKCHQKEVVAACGLDTSKQNAPTKYNDLYSNFAPLMQIDKILPKNIERIIKKDVTKYTVTYKHPSTGNTSAPLTVYSDSSEINDAVDFLCKSYGFEIALVEPKIREDIEKLSHFTVKGHSVTKDEYLTIKYICDASGLDGNGFIRAFFRKTSLHDELHTLILGEVDDLEPSEIFCKHVRSFQ
ncbi:hypothetical protein ABT56_19225 [Photobacterium aquae]|uniref:Replication initiator protein RctB central region domain-containing protein n=1 Tax=Photobacterium aquae TaxID=1195763 RepID=A0A0J1GVA8_9GAMM|nr:replication initiator protein RctB domain-containing protein [Photobacterium aquae]KLV03561.1 hypothetical protein ABT56_19225 [Photobacterium aquae]